MMRRRRYLRATALALAGGLAGCSEFGASGDDPASTETAEPTATPTETAEPTPRDEPRNVEAPLYMDLLPRPHLKGTGGTYSDNAVFTKIDWKWYLQNRETVPKFGPTSNESWSFRPSQGNFQRAPSADVLKTPVYGALVTVNLVETMFSGYPDLGPELERQCGLQAEAGEREDARVVDEVLNYYTPNVTHFIGADTDAVRDVLEGNKVQEYDAGDVQAYQGTDNASGRAIFVSDEQARGVVAVETADEQDEATGPTVNRTLDLNDSVVEEESVQWCLDELVDAPVVTGEVNGGRPEFADYPHGNRDLEPIEPFDVLLFGMDVSEYAGTVQAIVSDVDGGAPEAEALGEAFAESTGEYGTRYHPNVSTISASW
ncbi:hypothetical protein BRD14_08150 [Halobacteriales archaeon SW_5_68_122]|nr:MAG: hypothetical protein BRD14_08150 [Halobacteriales archaeon SW_5_68_122]